ncbi:MAG: hypothetical protein GY839_07700 [candidate division Zixibacteria bacterium]|nr:hypothetical protein [candidate division Zixibacteria bacterium]
MSRLLRLGNKGTTTLIIILAISLVGFGGCKKSTEPDHEPSYYIGNVNTEVFHRPSCSYLPDPENRIRFDTRGEAVEAGYRACQHCEP